MSIFSNPHKVFDNLWDEISHIFNDDAKPFVKMFFQQFASDEGRMILAKSIAAAPRLNGEPFNTVATSVLADVTAASAVIAAQDATKTLLAIQSALQIAKVSDNIVTPSDQAALTKAV